MFLRSQILFVCFFCFLSCTSKKHENKNELVADKHDSVNEIIILKDSIAVSEIEEAVLKLGLVDITKVDSTIKVDLKYSSTDNFIGIDVYDDYNKCYLQSDVALKLKNAQTKLKSEYPYYNIIVFDAVRPVRIQHKLWDLIQVPEKMKSTYVSNPDKGSLHNYGAAVDVSIVDENGVELDMGTSFDFFGELAYPREEDRMISEGKLSYKQLLNREILRDVMIKAGFFPITSEWWHFNSCSLKEASIKYKIVE